VVKGDVFELGATTRLRGTPVMLLELTPRQHSYSKEPASVRNLVFYDSESGKSSWLFAQYGDRWRSTATTRRAYAGSCWS
jgi:hypothetical protein